MWAEQTLRARPVGCDAESDEDAELMCRRSSEGEKLLFNQPALESAVQRTPVRPKEKGFLEERAFEVDLEPQLRGGHSETTGSGGDSTQGAQAGTPPRGAIPRRSRETV